MAGMKEFKERIESDAAFKAKFKELKTDEERFALAKAEGYDIEQLGEGEASEDELDKVAGGDFFTRLVHLIGVK